MLEKLKKQMLLDNNSDKSLLSKVLDNKIYRTSIGAIVGGILGFFYWKYIGCTAGSCPLTSNPYQSIILFGVLGAFLVKDKNEKRPKKEAEEQQVNE